MEHLGYDRVAEIYGVDRSAVGQWLKRYELRRPTVWETRRRGVVPAEPSEQELRARVGGGESLHSIAKAYGLSHRLLSTRCRQYGIPVRYDGWRDERFPCRDGHLARSTYEVLVDDWLSDHGLDHELEPRYPWDRRYRADFLVGQTYIEVWGVTGYPIYQQRRELKIRRCRETGLDLIGIGAGSFRVGGAWQRKLERLALG